MDNMKQEQIKVIQADLRAAFVAIGEKHKISIAMGSLTYNDLYFTCPIKGRFLDAKGSTEEADKAEWDAYCGKFGLKSDMFGKVFVLGGKTYKIIGIKPKARKYPVVGQVGSGGKYVFSAFDVIMSIGKLTFQPISAPVERQTITAEDVGSVESVLGIDKKEKAV
jgi:hypothetical protein